MGTRPSLGIDGFVGLISILFELSYFIAIGTSLMESIHPDNLGRIMAIVQSGTMIVIIIFVNHLFKVKRLQKGILFWENKEAMRVGIFFSIIIMINRSMPAIIQEHFYGDIVFAYLLIFCLAVTNICTFGLYFWWRYHTTALYHQRIKERDITGYITEITEKDSKIKSLSESNEFLSKTAHRDNKLIPAMYNAVSRFLNSQEKSLDVETKAKGLSILGELDEIMRERENIILESQRKYNILPSTNIERIDNVLNFMFSKAMENEISFDFVLTGGIEEIAIPSNKLGTLLADLIENAIIAVSHSTHSSEYKKILVEMGTIDNHLEITIQDSGIPFEIETLANLGIENSVMYQISDS